LDAVVKKKQFYFTEKHRNKEKFPYFKHGFVFGMEGVIHV
jgi:hypothetical protein